ncbi:MAG: hypothetical protein KGL35_06180 [Bradyrhizobium sp.]|nr:hypothetical protein [Bradyrhizobium sp.]
MTCPSCAKAQANPLTGWFNLNCLECCCRLIESTRPSVEQREAMFEAIAWAGRYRNVPTRTQIAAQLRQTRETNPMQSEIAA